MPLMLLKQRGLPASFFGVVLIYQSSCLAEIGRRKAKKYQRRMDNLLLMCLPLGIKA
jgi:hypothetical protein